MIQPLHFVTVFDKNYLLQGLALYRSLQRHTESFVLWIVCGDNATFDFFSSRNWDSIRPVALENLLDERLRKAQKSRKAYEFYWTLTPFTFDFVFGSDQGCQEVTYVDADLWFLGNPLEAIEAFRRTGKSVLLTEHGFSKRHLSAAVFGKFNVQFLTMSRAGSENPRRWWQNRCLEWCYARLEDGKFGDQKYLDSLPELFEKHVYIEPRVGRFLGPWNVAEHALSEAIAFHFHSLRILKFGLIRPVRATWDVPRWFGRTLLPQYLVDVIWATRVVRRYNQAKNSTLPLFSVNPKETSTWPVAAGLKIEQFLWRSAVSLSHRVREYRNVQSMYLAVFFYSVRVGASRTAMRNPGPRARTAKGK